MSMRSSSTNVIDASEGGFLESLINPRHLNPSNLTSPELIWPSMKELNIESEFDRNRIPSLDLIEARNLVFRNAKDRDQLLGCEVFWKVFRRSKLIIIFDRHMTTKLLRRIRDDINSSRSLETVLLFAGKDETLKSELLVKDIQQSIAQSKSYIKFHFFNGMTSTSTPFPHDRFAVTDGEFWHFGGTAGGFEQCLTAVSRGWRALDVGAIEFIKSAWKAMEQERCIK